MILLGNKVKITGIEAEDPGVMNELINDPDRAYDGWRMFSCFNACAEHLVCSARRRSSPSETGHSG